MTSRKFYFIFLTACIAGFTWLGVSMVDHSRGTNEGPGVCLFKGVTDIPCPSCGSTRAVLYLLQGDLSAACNTNPIGILVLLILVTGPVWMAYDLVSNQKSLWTFYGQLEKVLRKRSVAIPLILFVLANWAWNIIKGV